jgi:periplasmic protein TonB
MREVLRWAASFVLVAAAHAGAVAMTLNWLAHTEAPQSEPPAAVILELAPLPAAPDAKPVEAPVGPDLSEVVPEPEPPPPVEMPPVIAAVTLPAPEPPPPVDLRPLQPRKPVEKKPEKKPLPKAAAPQALPERAPVASARMPGATPEPASAALPTWKGTLLRHLERHKRYPPEAQRARQQGTAYVHFTMSRDGRVLSARIERAAGVASLDKEGLDLLQRAQPLPPLPSDQPGETLALVVPVQFFLRR